MRKNIFLYLLFLIFECCCFAVIFLYFETTLIVPLVLLIIIFATTIISFVKTVFIGKKYIKIEDGKLLIKRKENIILSVNKNEIEKLVVIYDIFFEDIDFIKFQYNGKKYFFEIPAETNDELKVYINDLNYKRKRTILLRVVLTILGVYY